jgi:hypothetical protein
MGIQSLREKEQQHAFQHATSAEVCIFNPPGGARV